MLLYPVKKVVGEFEIKAILSDDVDALWSRTCDHSGISKDYYDSYFEKRGNSAKSIQIGKLKRYKTPKEISRHQRQTSTSIILLYTIKSEKSYYRRDTEEGSPKDQRVKTTKKTENEHKQDQRAGF